MAVNSFSVLDGEMNSIGSALYLGASIMDHSCQPNAVATFDGRKLNIRTLVDLPRINWDTIFISYIDQMDDTETRRKSLKDTYYFLCACSKCVLHGQDERNMYPALCPDCSGAFCVTVNSCSSVQCTYRATPEFKEEYQEVTDFSKIKLTEMSNTACEWAWDIFLDVVHFILRIISDLDMAKVCLKRQETILHPLNLLRVKTWDIAFESAITLGKCEEAMEFGKLLLPGFM